MHKGIILLTKAFDREMALENVTEFLEDYYEKVFDWYAVGNRWHNMLAPKEKTDVFHKWVKEEFKDVFKEHGYAVNDLENDIVRPKIQAKWEELGLKGKNPYWSAYGFDVNDTENDYNVVPLKECIDIVKEFALDVKEKKEEIWNDMLEAKKLVVEGKYDMTTYYAGIYSTIARGCFSSECNVFDIEEEVSETIPENIDGYWAVMIDIHH